jgi:Fic family protein
MKREIQGQYVTISTLGEKARAFIPAPLPPNPSIEWTPELRSKFDHALLALGRLDSISTFLPDIALFLYMYVRKEAVLSSMIEGTQSSLSDLLLFEQDMEPGVPLDDVRDVSNYVAALDYGLKRLAEGFPLSLRLIKEMHAVLLSKGKGSNQTPGQFRRTQNWIGGRVIFEGASNLDGSPNHGLQVTGEKTGITPATVNKSLEHLERLGIVRELTSRKRNRIFSYAGYLEIVNRGTELPD